MNTSSRVNQTAAQSPIHRLALRASFMLVMSLFACNAFGQTLTTLYNFGAFFNDATAPGSGVIIDKNGNLFGATGFGGRAGRGGTVFELSPPAVAGQAWTETILRRFNGPPNDGQIAESRPVMTSDGELLGTTLRGGTVNLGTVYRLTPPVTAGDAWKEKILHNFGTIPGDVVSSNLGLFVAPEGLYGVDQGGENNFGAFYLLTPPAPHTSTWTQHILYTFQGSGDAADPSGELVRDSSGNFFGVTAQGGANNLGAVYELSPPATSGGSWTEQVIYSFNFTDGTLPGGRLLLGPDGVLFGTASGGGADQNGLVFRLNPPAVAGDAWTETILYTFTGGADGTSPNNGVISNSWGQLFGTAGNVIFMLRPPRGSVKSYREVALHTFTGPDGFAVNTPLTMTKGTLYGTTTQGGIFGKGTAFKLTLP